ncbi:DUF6363 domain-containing protein, partial [Vibrio fortis]
KQGYEKRPPRSPWLVRKLLKKTPQLAEAMITRADQYNQTLAFINNPPHDCTIEVIVPDDTFEVGRLTTDKDKLEAGYQMGLKAAEKALQSA